jgi:hypothetical protein
VSRTAEPGGLAATALLATVYTYPLYEMARVRHRVLFSAANKRRVPSNAFSHGRALLDPRNRTVTLPNVDTLYSTAWLDLGGAPLVLDVPAFGERYYSLAFMDMYTNVYEIVGRRTRGGKAGRYLVAGSQWRGDTPAGMALVRSPTRWNWLLGRFGVDSAAELPAVHALQDCLKLVPLPGSGSAGAPTNADAQAIDLEAADPAAYFTVVNAALSENPPPAADADVLARIATIGIGPGKTFAWESLAAADRAAISAGMAEARASLEAKGVAPAQTGWSWQPPGLGRYGSNYAFRAGIALTALAALPPEEAMYLASGSDAGGAPLDGRNRYRMRFAAAGLPPVDAFWSITMYNVESDGRSYLVPNALGRYAIGDRTPGLVRDADGGLTLNLQHAEPASETERANWLPAPAGPFRLCLRVYEPRAALLEQTYRVPAVERLG